MNVFREAKIDFLLGRLPKQIGFRWRKRELVCPLAGLRDQLEEAQKLEN